MADLNEQKKNPTPLASPTARILGKKFKSRSVAKEIQGYVALFVSTCIVCVIFYLILSRLFAYNRLYEGITDVNVSIVKCLNQPKDSACDNIDYEELKDLNTQLLSTMNKQDTALTVTDSIKMLVVLTVGFFLVHVFLRLYRYNMNMASFYRSLADAFLVLEIERGSLGGIKFDVLANMLLPKYISLETPDFKGAVDLSSFLGKEKGS